LQVVNENCKDIMLECGVILDKFNFCCYIKNKARDKMNFFMV